MNCLNSKKDWIYLVGASNYVNINEIMIGIFETRKENVIVEIESKEEMKLNLPILVNLVLR